MRILFVGYRAAHAQTSLAQALYPGLEGMGHRLIRCDPHTLATLFGHEGAQRLIVYYAKTYRPHVVLLTPPYDLVTAETCLFLRSHGFPVVGLRYDDPLHLAALAEQPANQARLLHAGAAKTTVTLTTSRQALAMLEQLGVPHARYFRFAYSAEALSGIDRGPETAVGFIGSPYADQPAISNRLTVLRALVARGIPLALWGQGWQKIPDLAPHWRGVCPWEDLGATIRGTAINLNVNGWVAPMVKNRSLEILAAGGFQITDPCPELDDYWLRDQEIVTAASLPELVDKIAYFLERPAEREAIVQAGRDRLLRDHTWQTRWPELVALTSAFTDEPIVDDDQPDYVNEDAAEPVRLAALALAHVSEAAGRYSEAAYYYRQVLALAPQDYGALAGEARLAALGGRLDLCQARWEEALGRFSPQGFAAHTGFAVLGLPGAGTKTPDDPAREALLQLAAAAEARGDVSTFRRLLPDLAAADFHGTLAWASAQEAQGRFRVAGEVYDYLWAEAPTQVPVGLGLARCLLRLGAHDGLTRILGSVLALEPACPEALHLAQEAGLPMSRLFEPLAGERWIHPAPEGHRGD